jgi:hypothetical protein
MELALAVAMIALAYAWAMAAHRQSVVTVVLAGLFFACTAALLWKTWQTITL